MIKGTEVTSAPVIRGGVEDIQKEAFRSNDILLLSRNWLGRRVHQTSYGDLLIESLRYCQREKGLIISAWCMMGTHVHWMVGRDKEFKLESIIRDFKKFTSVHLGD